MARKFQMKRGLEANLPTLSAGEPAFTTDETRLYVGTGSKNIGMATKAEVVAAQTAANNAASAAAAAQSTADGKAAATHYHAAGDITSGTLAVARGGTGVTSNPSMLTNLGSTSAASVFAASPRPGVTGTLPVANGGTGNTSVDTTPTSESTKMVTSGGVYTALSGKASTATYTASVTTTWTADSTNGGYYQTVSVSGMLASDNPIADVVLGGSVETNAQYLAAWALVTRIVTAANAITLYANGEAPTTAFTVQLKVVR